MDVLEKLTILTDAAKYDAACTSSGVQRGSRPGMVGNTTSSIAGCCHSFSADGRCITLLKVLMTNVCAFDCKYCINRRSNDTRRAAFTPRELAELTIGFYRRNYIEGLFLSSGVLRSPDYTTEQMIRALRILREEYRFNGYIHAKAIPGTSPELVEQLGLLADRLSVNIELPSQTGLQTLAPDKTKEAILRPMGQIRDGVRQSKAELAKYRHAPVFAPAGQSTQLIVGATGDDDRHPQQRLQIRPHDLHRELLQMCHCPTGFRIEPTVEVGVRIVQQLRVPEAVEAQQPVRLIQPMLPQQRRFCVESRDVFVAASEKI